MTEENQSYTATDISTSLEVVGMFDEKALPDGAMQLAQGANRVARQLKVDRGGEYELSIRFSVPEDLVFDLTSVVVYRHA